MTVAIIERPIFTFGEEQEDAHDKFIKELRKPTTGVINFYKTICEQKHQPMQDISTWSYDELYAENQRIKSLNIASESQMSMITDKIKELQEVGYDLDIISDKWQADLDKGLTGGKEGTASLLIQDLFQAIKESKNMIPPTEEQIKLLIKMYPCPEVPFENFGIIRRYIDVAEMWEIKTKKIERKEVWHRPSYKEFEADVIKKMTHADTSRFISEYRGIHFAWTKTRITLGQVKLIKDLETRQMKIGAPPAIEYATNIFGKSVQKPIVTPVSNTKGYNPNAFEPLDDVALMQFSEKEAEVYINVLLKDKEDVDLTKFEIIADNATNFESMRYDNMQYKRESGHYITTEEERIKFEFEAIQDIMFKLEASAGYYDEDLHDAVVSLLIDNTDKKGQLMKKKIKIKDMMIDLIETKAITFEGMAELCSDSAIAVHILIGRF